MCIAFGSFCSYCSPERWEEVAIIETQGNPVGS